MRLLALGIVVTALTGLGACSTMTDGRAPTLASAPKATLDFTTWELVALEGQPTDPTRPPTLTLDSAQQRLHGFAGCNRYMGGYSLEGEKLSIQHPAATLMACPDMQTEQGFLKALSEINRYRLDANVLELFQGEELRLRFKAKAY